MVTSSSSPSNDWDPLGTSGAFYRRIQLYSLSWSLPGGGDLSDYVVVGARNGGPIALTRDESKPVLLLRDTGSDAAAAAAVSSRKKRIWIYSSAGILLHNIVWDHNSKIVKLGFTDRESLVVLAKDGTYRLYPISPQSATSIQAYSQHSLSHDVGDAAVHDARIYEGGMVILLSTYQFLEVKRWPERDALSEKSTVTSLIASAPRTSREPPSANLDHGKGRIERFVESGLDKYPSTWCILTPEQSTSRQAEVLMSSGESLMGIDQLEVQDQRFSRGPFSDIVPSPSGRFIAMLTQRKPQKLYVVSSNYAETLSEYDLSNEPETEPPKRVLWCGSNSVVLAWDNSILMVGPYGQTLRYYYVDPVHLFTEVDGVRIVSMEKCEFLQKVPPSLVAIFQPGSVHAAAMLFEAYELFSDRDPRSHEMITNIRPDLVEAVDTCTDAAGREIDVAWQRNLLKAASFGKTFLDLYNPADFVAMSQTLRVLNAARYYEIGLPITYDQYLTHSPATLVLRLVLRGHYLLALRVCDFLKLSSGPVLRHWSMSKVAESKNDQEDSARVSNLIVKRLRSAGGTGASEISCADIAGTAWEQGKTILATKLLEHEARASKQVHLLLSMKEDNLALSKAIKSGDSDLVLSVLLALRRQHSLGTFFRFLDGKHEAIAILTNYGKKYDKDVIKDFWFQDDRRTESACFELDEAALLSASAQREEGRTDMLTAEQFSAKMDHIRAASKTFGEDRDRSFEARTCEDHLNLLAFQQTLQSEAGPSFLVPLAGLSLNETVRQCLVNNWPKKADKLHASFKIPDRRWTYLKLKALTETRDWEQLELFAKKRPSIGYEAFAEHLISTGNSRQALSYIQRSEGRNRSELYVKAGEWIKAGEECRGRGDRGKLNELVSRAPNQIIASQLNAFLDETRAF